MLLKDHKEIAIILALFLIVNFIFLIFYDDVWWDSSVYIGMGKYIYSLGKAGLWEESRPLILPLIIGLGWLLDFNVVYFARVLSIIFAISVIFMVYLIGSKLFSRKIGLLAALFTAFSYHFLFFSPNILTEIPSTFFVLLAFYFFIENKFFLVGLFSGIAVMTRLFQVFTLIGIGLTFLLYFYNKKYFHRRLHLIIFGFLIFILPYAVLNYSLYHDVLLPFKSQTHLTKTTGWMLYKEYEFYFTGLLKENFFILFLLLIPFFYKRNYKFSALVLVPLIYLAIFSVVKHKEMRFVVVILPFLYMFMSYILFEIYSKISYKKLSLAVFFILVVFWLVSAGFALKGAVDYKNTDEGLLYFQNYLKENKGNVWISNPLYTLYSDEKVEGLLYFYSSENLIKFIEDNKGKVDIVMFNNCDMPCPPEELDSLCGKSRKVLSDTLSRFKKVYGKEVNSCEYQIFRKAT